jgi:hypothetical protein
LYCAIFFKSALLAGALYFLGDYDANAQSRGDGSSVRVVFFDKTGRIENGTMVLRFNYTFTHDKEDDIESSHPYS